MKFVKKYLPQIFISFLFLITISITFFTFSDNQFSNRLLVVFMDVGQGDAIYIETPNKKQMLIDGGPDNNLLSNLSDIMPFADRSIDLVLVTHPDQDHIGGLPLLMSSYSIDSIIESGATSDSKVYASLEEQIAKNKVKKVIAQKGMRVVLDKEENIFFDILFPDRDISNLESNDGSIVGKLTYGETSFMFMGDATTYTENLIKWNEDTKKLKSDILKLGHHGAKTSSSILWLEKVSPKFAIISAGKNNRYGHPHQDVLDRLATLKIPYLSTYEKGNIIVESNGVELNIK